MTKTKSQTSAAKMKNKFRRSEQWINFRLEKYAEQGGLDAITHKPLRPGFNCHHKDLHPENYQILKSENFCCLNLQSHDFIHWLYRYYEKDEKILLRIAAILSDMKRLSETPIEVEDIGND